MLLEELNYFELLVVTSELSLISTIVHSEGGRLVNRISDLGLLNEAFLEKMKC